MEAKALNRSRLLLTLRVVGYIASLIWMGSLHQSNGMRRARDVCEGICNRKMLHCLYYCKYEILFFGDDVTGPAVESKSTKRVQGWSRQITRGGF